MRVGGTGRQIVAERYSGLVKAIESLFRDLGVDIVEERVTRFVLQEIHAGKSLEESLKEPYVINNTTPEWRRQVLEQPEIIKAVEEEIEKSFRTRGGGP